MSLLLVGLNHKTAPLELRERLAFTESDYQSVLPVLAKGAISREALVLSTCNRVEILIETDETDPLPQIVNFWGHFKNIAPKQFSNYLYHFSGVEAARHLFRVAASLDSMIVGETQILGQVRQSYRIASEAGTTRRVLHKLLHHAFHTAKRVRTETRIANNAVSIASAAINLAQKVFSGTLENKTVLLVGAGEMAELAAKHLVEHGAGRILIANRTYQNAVKLAMEFTGEVIAFENLALSLSQADIVICSTSAQDFLITPEMVKASQIERHNRPVLFIDISVPRNISPDISGENIFLYSVDDLEMVITSNLSERQKEAVRAEAIVEEEVAEFWRTLQTMNFGETLGELRQKMQEKARNELDKQRSKLGSLSPEQEAAIEKLLLSTVNQIAHPILYGLRQAHEYGSAEFAETLCD
ncbi:MAG: glutamyl-tRNA reductase, partial [Pyrinomonadaceae bacterium]